MLLIASRYHGGEDLNSSEWNDSLNVFTRVLRRSLDPPIRPTYPLHKPYRTASRMPWT